MEQQIDLNRVNEALVIMLAQELHQYCMEGEARFNSSEDDYFPDSLDGRIRQIGRFLDDVGEFNLMVSVYCAMPRKGQSYINQLWDGIGTWYAGE